MQDNAGPGSFQIRPQKWLRPLSGEVGGYFC
jgi:hypothetical protein